MNVCEGWVKLRLCHGDVGSILVPELAFSAMGGCRVYQPGLFSPPVLGFGVEDGLHEAVFTMDVGSPVGSILARVVVRIRSDGLERRYDDGAQLYRCTLTSEPGLRSRSAARARRRRDGDFDVELFHITYPSAYASIRSGGELRSSAWNLQGTRELSNVAYAYLTSLPRIRCDDDLRRIAMSSDEVISFQTTSHRAHEDRLDLRVYRESTGRRTASLRVTLATALLSPPHLLLHRPMGPAYYEVVAPQIYRVGVVPGVPLAYDAGTRAATVADADLKRFSYLVLGDASQIAGIAAPYDEEATDRIVHVEPLDGGDLFDFWRSNPNSDQMSGRTFERRLLTPPARSRR